MHLRNLPTLGFASSGQGFGWAQARKSIKLPWLTRPSIRKCSISRYRQHRDVATVGRISPCLDGHRHNRSISSYRARRPMTAPFKCFTEASCLTSAPCSPCSDHRCCRPTHARLGRAVWYAPLAAWHYRCCSSPLFRTLAADETGSLPHIRSETVAHIAQYIVIVMALDTC